MGALGVRWRGMVGISWDWIHRMTSERRVQERKQAEIEGWHKRGSVSPTNITGGSFPSLNEPNE